jgi:hypothetical protein
LTVCMYASRLPLGIGTAACIALIPSFPPG